MPPSYPIVEDQEFWVQENASYNVGPWISVTRCASCHSVSRISGKNITPKQALTMPIFSAYFLLLGLVSLLTSVPSGYKMKHNGFPSLSASLPRDARSVASCLRSDAHERARKIKLKNCMPCHSWMLDLNPMMIKKAYPANDWNPAQTLL